VFLEMAKVEPIVAEVGELLTVLTVKLESAPVEEIPSLIGEAKQQARRLLECHLASDPIRHLRQEKWRCFAPSLSDWARCCRPTSLESFACGNSPAAGRRGIEADCQLTQIVHHVNF
jgi:hypothetical protein